MKTTGKRTPSKKTPAGANRLLVRRWGNSAGVRIPMNAMRAAKLKLDQEVEVYAEDGRIVIDPIVSKKQSLKEMLSKLTPENSHEFVEDTPLGSEIW